MLITDDATGGVRDVPVRKIIEISDGDVTGGSDLFKGDDRRASPTDGYEGRSR
jgi:hypothetical protein